MPQQLVSRKRPAPPAAQEIESPLAVDNSAECTPPTNARFRGVSPRTSSPTDSRTPASPRNAYARTTRALMTALSSAVHESTRTMSTRSRIHPCSTTYPRHGFFRHDTTEIKHTA